MDNALRSDFPMICWNRELSPARRSCSLNSCTWRGVRAANRTANSCRDVFESPPRIGAGSPALDGFSRRPLVCQKLSQGPFGLHRRPLDDSRCELLLRLALRPECPARHCAPAAVAGSASTSKTTASQADSVPEPGSRKAGLERPALPAVLWSGWRDLNPRPPDPQSAGRMCAEESGSDRWCPEVTHDLHVHERTTNT